MLEYKDPKKNADWIWGVMQNIEVIWVIIFFKSNQKDEMMPNEKKKHFDTNY